MNNIYEIVKQLKGREQEIPDCGRDDLPEFFKKMGFTVGVEIGVAQGEYSEILCKGGFKLYSVDPYIDYEDYSGRNIQRRLDKEYSEAKQRLSNYNCTIIRKTSMEAAKDFENESIDFVYIDGHHEFKYVAEDIWEWSKKVKKGGVVAGHDFVYTHYQNSPYVCHVKHVVRAYTAAHRIPNWYVLGRKHFSEGNEIRDQWRSWFWIKE